MLNIIPSPSQSNLNLIPEQITKYFEHKKNVSLRKNRKRKETTFIFSGTQKETTFYHCRLLLETETEPGTKSRFHSLWIRVLSVA